MNTKNKHHLAAAHKKGNGKKRGQWGKANRVDMTDWSHDQIGSIYFQVKGGIKLSRRVHFGGPNTWRLIDLGQLHPSAIEIDFTYSLNEGVELVHGHYKRVVDTAEDQPEPFKLDIVWNGDVPRFVQGYAHDFQLYAINSKTGFIIHLDVAVVSRDGRFWLTVQEVTGAQIVKHDPNAVIDGFTSIILGDSAYTLFPEYNENRYPGFDPVASWNKTYVDRADKVLGYAAEFGAAIPFEQASIGEWQPEWPKDVPEKLAKQGYKKAVVLWYNLTLGYGFLQLEDGRQCFVHFKNVLNEQGLNVGQQGDFPVLQPSTGCYVKWQLQEDQKTGEEKPKATAVRPVKPVEETASAVEEPALAD